MLHESTELSPPSLSTTSFAFDSINEFKLNNMSFTTRELDVISCVMNGRTSKKAIAAMLLISPGTVATHIRNIMLKLHCNSLESIREIIEHSDQLSFLQDYYKHLLWQETYNALLLKLKQRLSSIQINSVINLMCSTMEYPALHNDLEYLQAVILYLGLNPTLSIKTIGSSDIPDSSINFYFSSALPINGYFVMSTYDSIDMLLIDVLNEIIEPKLIADLIDDYRNVTLEDTLPQYQSYTRISSHTSLWNRVFSFYRSLSLRARIAGLSAMVGSIGIIAGYSLFYAPNHPTLTRSDLAVPIAGTCLPRSELVTSIQQKLSGDHQIPIVALVGMSGVGKTMLARMVSKQHTGSLVWELSAHNLSSLKASIKDLADGLAKTADQKKELGYINNLNNGDAKDRKLLSFVKEALLKEKNWLLIFDDVDSLSDINAYIPLDPKTWGMGKVILTTCNSNLQNAYFLPKDNIVEVQELSPEESLALFIKIVCGARSVDTSEQLEIAEFLKHIPPFPLDISVTAQYILHNQISYSDYLERMQQQGFHETQETLLKEMHQHSHSRHHLMSLSIQHVLETQPEFVDLFLMICMLDAGHIPRIFLESSKSKLIVDNFMLQMKKYSLIHQDTDATNIKTFSIPKVTQDIGLQYLREFIGAQNLPHRKLAVIQSVEHVVKSVLDAEDNEYLKILTPHLKRLIALDDISPISQANLKCLLGCTYYYLGNDDLTIELVTDGISQLDSNPLGHELKIAVSLSCLGESYRNKGMYNEGIAVLEKALGIYAQRDSMSINHARTLTYLGNAYRLKGIYGKAKTVLQQSIDIYKRHPKYQGESAQPLGVLSTVHRDLGEYKAACSLMEKSLELYKSHEQHHMWTIMIGLCLGSSYTSIGDPQKGQNTLETCNNLIHKRYSEDHPLYPWILMYLGDSLRHQGNLEGAKKYLEEANTLFEARYSDHHSGHGHCLGRLGAVYVECGNLEKATQLIDHAYLILNETFGKDHFQLGYPQYLLGRAKLKQTELDKAESYLKTSLELYTQVNHTDMHYPLTALAEVYAEKAKKEKELKNITTSLHHEQQARDYLTRALNIVKERCIENSTHELKILALRKKFGLN